ncbi:MAG: N-acetyltransferase GCN5 [Nitrospirales bacterium]|nr:MAG: N-acetyltransferase GCN5 [Nitrospirales bacterium]
MPTHAKSNVEVERCFDLMSELRTHLKRHEFVALVRMMETEGYKLAYTEVEGHVVAVAGYRIFTNLFMGKTPYVDDLVTASKHRSKGYGKALVSWLREIAHEHGCFYYHLDSGTQRHEAHNFYFRQGFRIASFHFSERLTDR